MRKKGGRVKVKGSGRAPKKFMNKPATFEFKYEVLKHLQSHTMEATIRKYFLCSPAAYTTTIYKSLRRKIMKWKQGFDHVNKMASSESTKHLTRSRAKRGATTLSLELELSIVQWINALRREGIPVSAEMLRLHALDVASSIGIHEGFSASNTWIKSFLTRHKLSFRQKTRQGQVSGCDAHKMVKEFSKKIQHLVQQNGIDTIYNADQTAVFYEYIPKTTIDATGTKTVWVKCGGKEKERLTAMLLGDNNGNKYDPFVVVKTQPSKIPEMRIENNRLRHGFGKLVWQEISNVQDETSMEVYGNKTGWWNAYLSIQFLTHFFGTRNKNDKPILLIWDDFSAHWTSEVTEFAKSKNIFLEKVPPCYTFCCQPADIAWNKPLKDYMRKAWRAHLHKQVKILQEKRTTKPNEKFKLEPPSRRIVLHWLNEGWQKVGKVSIESGFKAVSLLFDEIQSNAMKDKELLEAFEAMNLIDPNTVSADQDVVTTVLRE